MNKIKKFWKRFGGMILFTSMVLTTSITIYLDLPYLCKVIGMHLLLTLTVPCGDNRINTNKYLWFLRQFIFLSLAVYGLAN